MYLELKGKGSLNKKEIEFAILFFMKNMNAHKILNNCDITVKFKNLKDVAADCLMVGRKEYEIQLNTNLDKKEAYSALAHELVHIKQFFRREIIFSHKEICYWKGKRIDCSKLNYYNYPWEIEAYGREFGMAILICEYLQNEKKSVANKKRTK